MSRWIEVAELSKCPPGASLEKTVVGQVVAIYNVSGQVYATDGICAHQGGPLGKGALNGCTITCPWHGWQYDVRTGQQCLSPSVRLKTFPVRVEGDRIWIEMDIETDDDAVDATCE